VLSARPASDEATEAMRQIRVLRRPPAKLIHGLIGTIEEPTSVPTACLIRSRAVKCKRQPQTSVAGSRADEESINDFNALDYRSRPLTVSRAHALRRRRWATFLSRLHGLRRQEAIAAQTAVLDAPGDADA